MHAAIPQSTQHPTIALERPNPPQPSMFATRLAYLEAANRVSLIANIAQAATLALVLLWTYGIYRASLVRDVRFFGVTNDGGLQPINPDALKFRPTDQILRSFLLKFVKEHQERVSLTVAAEYGHSLQFMDRRLTSQGIQDDIKAIKKLRAGEGDEVRVRVANVTLANLEHGCANGSAPRPCTAKVDYEKSFFARAEQRLIETKKYSASIEFVLKTEITNDMVADNPIGLIITSFHEYEGWE